MNGLLTVVEKRDQVIKWIRDESILSSNSCCDISEASHNVLQNGNAIC